MLLGDTSEGQSDLGPGRPDAAVNARPWLSSAATDRTPRPGRRRRPARTASAPATGRPPASARTTMRPSSTRRATRAVVRGQQVDAVARPEAVEVDPGRGAQAEKQRLRRQVLRTQELLRLDRTLPRRESSLPARRASLVPPAAGRRRGVRGGERVRRRAETEVRRVVPVLAVVPRLVGRAAREVGDLVRRPARVREEAVRELEERRLVVLGKLRELAVLRLHPEPRARVDRQLIAGQVLGRRAPPRSPARAASPPRSAPAGRR